VAHTAVFAEERFSVYGQRSTSRQLNTKRSRAGGQKATQAAAVLSSIRPQRSTETASFYLKKSVSESKRCVSHCTAIALHYIPLTAESRNSLLLIGRHHLLAPGQRATAKGIKDSSQELSRAYK